MQVLAGTISSLIFTMGTLNMLIKAWRTHDIQSYSLAHLALNNVGNAVHWLYVISLPFGPIWFLHGFFTVASVLMLAWCIMYRKQPETVTQYTTTTLTFLAQPADWMLRTLEFPPYREKGTKR